jgi:hypothetical protein
LEKIPERIWKFEEGNFTVAPNYTWGGDLISREKYSDFLLEFEWKIAPGSNSGIKYLVDPDYRDPTRRSLSNWFFRIGSLLLIIGIGIVLWGKSKVVDSTLRRKAFFRQRGAFLLLAALSFFLLSYILSRPGTVAIGLEFKLIDDKNRKEASRTETSGALYGIKPPKKRMANPVGQWNRGRIKVLGNQVEHWLNDELVLQYELGSPDLLNEISKSKFRLIPSFGSKKPGFISIQNHMSRVWFRNFEIQNLQNSQIM